MPVLSSVARGIVSSERNSALIVGQAMVTASEHSKSALKKKVFARKFNVVSRRCLTSSCEVCGSLLDYEGVAIVNEANTGGVSGFGVDKMVNRAGDSNEKRRENYWYEYRQVHAKVRVATGIPNYFLLRKAYYSRRWSGTTTEFTISRAARKQVQAATIYIHCQSTGGYSSFGVRAFASVFFLVVFSGERYRLIRI